MYACIGVTLSPGLELSVSRLTGTFYEFVAVPDSILVTHTKVSINLLFSTVISHTFTPAVGRTKKPAEKRKGQTKQKRDKRTNVQYGVKPCRARAGRIQLQSFKSTSFISKYSTAVTLRNCPKKCFHKRIQQRAVGAPQLQLENWKLGNLET